MRVVDVRSKSPAAEYGIKKGDILVGLHVWETIRPEDMSYILNQTSLLNGGEPLKFYVIRGQEVLYGNLRFASRQK
jgi:serine protease Do